MYTSVVVAARECRKRACTSFTVPCLLSERCNRSSYHLEREFRKFELTSEFMQDALPIVAGVHKPTLCVRKDERVGSSIMDRREVRTPRTAPTSRLFTSAEVGTAQKCRNSS